MARLEQAAPFSGAQDEPKKKDAVQKDSGLELAITPEQARQERKVMAEKDAKLRKDLNMTPDQRQQAERLEEDRLILEARQELFRLTQERRQQIHEGAARIDAKAADENKPLTTDEATEKAAVDSKADELSDTIEAAAETIIQKQDINMGVEMDENEITKMKEEDIDRFASMRHEGTPISMTAVGGKKIKGTIETVYPDWNRVDIKFQEADGKWYKVQVSAEGIREKPAVTRTLMDLMRESSLREIAAGKAAEAGAELMPDEKKEKDELAAWVEEMDTVTAEASGDLIAVKVDKAGMEYALADDAKRKKWETPEPTLIPEPPPEALMTKGERVVASVEKHGDDLRKIALTMRDQRTKVAELRAKMDKFSGLGAMRGLMGGGKLEKGRLEADLADAEKAYETMRAGYVGEKTYRKNKEDMLLADATGAALTKAKGVSGKIYEAYKWLGDQNLTKLGWKPTGKIAGAFARGVSLRSGVNIALLAGSAAIGGAAGVAAAVPFTRGISGTYGAIGSFDVMRQMWDRQKDVSLEDVRKMEPASLLSRMDALRAQAMLGGRAVSKDAEYLRLKAELGKREKNALKKGLLTTGYLGAAMDAADDRVQKAVTKRKIAGGAMKGIAAGVGYAIGSGAVADAVSGGMKNVGAGYDIIRERLMGGAGKAATKAAEANMTVGPIENIKTPHASTPDTLPAAPQEIAPQPIVESPTSPDTLPAAPPEADVTSLAPEAPGTVAAEQVVKGMKKAAKEAAKKAVQQASTEPQPASHFGEAMRNLKDAAPAIDHVEFGSGSTADFVYDAAGKVKNVAVSGEPRDIAGLLKGGFVETVTKSSGGNAMDARMAVTAAMGRVRSLDVFVQAYQTMAEHGQAGSPEAKFLAKMIFEKKARLVQEFGDIFRDNAKEAAVTAKVAAVTEVLPSTGLGHLEFGPGQAADFTYDAAGKVKGVGVSGWHARDIYSGLLKEDFAGIAEASPRGEVGGSFAVDAAEERARDFDVYLQAYEAMVKNGQVGTAEAKFLAKTIAAEKKDIIEEYGNIFRK